MGDWYDIQYLGSVPFLVCQSAETGWQERFIMLSPEQAEEVEEFLAEQNQQKKEFLKKQFGSIITAQQPSSNQQPEEG